MRGASAGTKALLASRAPCWKADCITVTLTDGTQDFWTTYDQPLKVGSKLWLAGEASPLVSRSTLAVRKDMEVPELALDFRAQGFMYRGAPFKQQILAGVIDGATIRYDRIFMPSPNDTSNGVVLMFLGKKGPVKQKGDLTTITVRGGNVTFKQPIPKNVYQTACLHTFCDVGCTLLKSTFTTNNTVGAGPGEILIPWGSVPANPALYAQGKITMTSGAAVGQVRAIRAADSSGILLSFPFYGVVEAGDTFAAMQGCDKFVSDTSGQSCADRNNTQHNRSFPYIPQATLAA